MTRQIVLDTETTGLEVDQGHRVIEIGCIELRERRVSANHFHHYLNPDRSIDAGAAAVHGLSNEFLAGKPRFGEIVDELVNYLHGAEVLIHNASFDVGFLDCEFQRAGRPERMATLCRVTDTLQLARKLHPGARASLDALCKRYAVDNSNRELHGALLDARLLADVYLGMTGGQAALVLEQDSAASESAGLAEIRRVLGAAAERPLTVVAADAEALARHRGRLAGIFKKAGHCLWSADLES